MEHKFSVHTAACALSALVECQYNYTRSTHPGYQSIGPYSITVLTTPLALNTSYLYYGKKSPIKIIQKYNTYTFFNSCCTVIKGLYQTMCILKVK
jgi:hypothetical protein